MRFNYYLFLNWNNVYALKFPNVYYFSYWMLTMIDEWLTGYILFLKFWNMSSAFMTVIVQCETVTYLSLSWSSRLIYEALSLHIFVLNELFYVKISKCRFFFLLSMYCLYEDLWKTDRIYFISTVLNYKFIVFYLAVFLIIPLSYLR